MDLRGYWELGQSFEAFVQASPAHRALWEGIHRLARIPEWAVKAVPENNRLHLLVIAEDWCGDGSNTVPVVARWVERLPGVDLRILRRDEHPELMNQYLTNGARSIPIIIILDEQFREVGHWGPRPRALQAWVKENKPRLPKEEFYPMVRRWYARDHGTSAICEILEAAGLPCAAAA